MVEHLNFLQRCADLAKLADSQVSPNPKVGAVLVNESGVIIGEGYHQRYGGAHAEVNCVASVSEKHRPEISRSTLFVSLEPCCIHGRTPPCTDLILRHRIPRVVIGQLDETAKVSGRGVAILREAGVEVTSYPGFAPTARVAAPRNTFAGQGRPFISLKFAQSADGFLAPEAGTDYWISNQLSRRVTHFWRSRTSCILVGARTVLSDNPQLSTRLYPGPSPVPVVFDPKGAITSSDFRLFSGPHRPILFQPERTGEIPEADQISLPTNTQALLTASQSDNPEAKESIQTLITFILQELHQRKYNHITVEGGALLLDLFIKASCWDEARVITGTGVFFQRGLRAPTLPGKPSEQISLGSDSIGYWINAAIPKTLR